VGDTLELTVEGDWSVRQSIPALGLIEQRLGDRADVRRLVVRISNLGAWDSALVSYLFGLNVLCVKRGIDLDDSVLPVAIRRLTALALSSPERTGAPHAKAPRSIVTGLGEASVRKGRALAHSVAFLGESALALTRMLRGRGRYRGSDLFLLVQKCGAQALPITTVIALLTGMILSFVGAIQLGRFGADIYDADLVAVAMSREMAAIMTGIVVAGRTGAAYAAEIGAMQANEEIDALSTLGIAPTEFLVVPRILALVLMMPLLCLYADAMGILGGYIVGMAILNVTSASYLLETQGAVTVTDFVVGIFKCAVFGALVASLGCLRGLQSGRDTAAVGAATTSAVVSGILAIIIADAVFAVILNILGL
jgi:phospholipid/cholesterol/gamma-HCH transport system permease protein